MSFKSLINKIFGNPSDPKLLKERTTLLRSEKEKQLYQIWLENQKDSFIAEFKNQLFERKEGDIPQSGIQIQLLISPASNGFICAMNPNEYDKNHYMCFFDFLKEKVLELNYKLYLSDVRYEEMEDYVSECQRHYLKPRYSLKEIPKKFNQQFGNLTIEYLLKDSKPVHVKFLCQPYRDSKFTDAKDFLSLMEIVLQ